MCKRKGKNDQNIVLDSKEQNEETDKIEEIDITEAMEEYIHVDLHELYEKTVAELGLQQTKRDQIITVYIALLAFLTPAVLEAEKMEPMIQGFLFLAAAIVGILFSFIIIRYRVYKEIYWLCCQSISVMFGVKKECMQKKYIRHIFYRTIEKKGRDFYVDDNFSKTEYIRKNRFSSETLYFIIHIFITALVLGLGVGMLFPIHIYLRIAIGAASAIALFLFLLRKYFVKCIEVYQVLIDKSKRTLKKTFQKAWFLHFYV